MPIDVSDLSGTIVPKSDQLNAEQLLTGPLTITVTDVRVGGGDEQPITVHYAGENGRPYKPCKTMRKLLIFSWGKDGRTWIGRSATLYNDPLVRFGGAEVGGIRISHLSHIDRDINLSLTSTRGKKAPHVVKRLVIEDQEERLSKLEARGREAAEMGKEAKARFWKSLSAADQVALTERAKRPAPAIVDETTGETLIGEGE